MAREVVIEARVEAQDLACIAKFLMDKGQVPRSRSELVYRAVAIAVFAIVRLEGWRPDTVQEAVTFLDNIGLGTMNRSGRGLTNLHRSLQEEALRLDGFDPSYASGPRRSRGTETSQGEILDMVKSILKQGGPTVGPQCEEIPMQQTTQVEQTTTPVSDDVFVDIEAFTQRNRATIDAFKATMSSMVATKTGKEVDDETVG